ncbi:MAG: heme ABC exporter ATP-binding protein CcmA [Gammaproteobacteria bacterium]|nr:heme ABC exporter ATP-binding protein CcmA [Gammaproteobacteria bacterium]
MIEAQNLTFDYVDSPLIQNLNFTLHPGQCVQIQGKNGAGKSTLLKLVVGLIRPHAGHILWQGHAIDTCMQAYLSQLVYVGHQNGLSEALTLEENLALDWHQGRSKRPISEGVTALQLDALMQMPVACLSKGQQRKAALLRLWMTDASVWVLDEPFSALDDSTQATIWTWIQDHLSASGSVLMTTHLGMQGRDVNVVALS